MAGEDLLEDDTGAGGGGKSGKHKPLSKGQKIGLAIGVVTILLIIYQVRKQSAANAATSSTSGSSNIDPMTGYPSGSAQDQAALAAMYGSSSPGSLAGVGGSSGGSVGGGWGPPWSNWSPGASPGTDPSGGSTGSSTTSSASTTPPPVINVTVNPETTNPASTTAATSTASTTGATGDSLLAGFSSELQKIEGVAKVNPSAVIQSGGATYVGVSSTGGADALKAKKYTVVGGKSIGGNPGANYVKL